MTRTSGLHHLAVQVVDLPRLERFYVEVLGLSVLRRWPAADGQGERSIWLDTGDGSFLALERVVPDRRAAGANAPGLFLCALRIAPESREAWKTRLAEAGVPIEKASPYTLYVRDPEGNRVGLSHWPTPAQD